MTDDQRSPADVIAESYFRLKVEQGLADIARGRVITDEEARKRFAKWLDVPDPGASSGG